MTIENKKTMLIVVLLGVITLLLSSCEKEEFEPYYTYEEIPADTTDWEDAYADGGVLDSVGGQTNPLVGTRWVLTKVVTSFATEYPNDTIDFVSNTNYTLNNGAVRPYQLNSLASSTNWDLSLYYFAPFGGSQYSAQVGYYFVDDGEINNAEFEDIQNPSSTIRAWFEKIN